MNSERKAENNPLSMVPHRRLLAFQRIDDSWRRGTMSTSRKDPSRAAAPDAAAVGRATDRAAVESPYIRLCKSSHPTSPPYVFTEARRRDRQTRDGQGRLPPTAGAAGRRRRSQHQYRKGPSLKNALCPPLAPAPKPGVPRKGSRAQTGSWTYVRALAPLGPRKLDKPPSRLHSNLQPPLGEALQSKSGHETAVPRRPGARAESLRDDGGSGESPSGTRESPRSDEQGGCEAGRSRG
jgi:hypothetical protein